MISWVSGGLYQDVITVEVLDIHGNIFLTFRLKCLSFSCRHFDTPACLECTGNRLRYTRVVNRDGNLLQLQLHLTSCAEYTATAVSYPTVSLTVSSFLSVAIWSNTSWSIPMLSASRITTSIHQVRRLPLRRFPPTFSGFHSNRIIGNLLASQAANVSILSMRQTRPYYRSLLFSGTVS